MKNNDQITSLLLSLIGLYVAFEGYGLKIGNLQHPEPGFLILWAGIILTLLSISLFIKSFYSSEGNRISIWKGVQWQRGFRMIIYLIVYVSIFQWLGFLISTFILLLFLFKTLESQKWSIALSLSAVTTLLCYFIFGYSLELRFPQGILERVFHFSL